MRLSLNEIKEIHRGSPQGKIICENMKNIITKDSEIGTIDISLSYVNEASKYIGGNIKAFITDYEVKSVGLLELLMLSNRGSISGPIYKEGHRKQPNIDSGSNIILIDCDEPGQSEIIEKKLEPFDHIKAPSASNSCEKPYKWHFILLVSNTMSKYPGAFKWQIEQLFTSLGIDDSMIDPSCSKDISRQFAPASIGMTTQEADEKSIMNLTGRRVDVEPVPDNIDLTVSESVNVKIPRIKKTTNDNSLPSQSLWFDSYAVSYAEAFKAIMDAGEGVRVSKFGCPHQNSAHSKDYTKGYGFGYLLHGKYPVIQCTGSSCKAKRIFFIPDPDAIDVSEFFKQQEETCDTGFEEKLSEKKMPIITEPIHPVDFADMMVKRMKTLNSTYFTQGRVYNGYQEFGALYNQCIDYNQKGLNKIIVCPSSTGSGKSVSAHLCCSKISKLGLSAMMVVSEVATAISAAETINELTGREVAGTYYSVSSDNPDNDLRCEIDELPQITIITHALFIQRSDSGKEIENLRLFDGKQRDLIIIDERIDLTKRISFATNEIPDAIAILSRDEKLKKQAAELSHINEILFDDGKRYNGSYTYEKDASEPGSMEQMFKEVSQRLTDYAEEIEEGKYNLKPKLRGRNKDYNNTKDEKEAANLLRRIAFVILDRFTQTKEGKVIVCHREEDLSGSFGSVVVLDASASINPEYTMRLTNGHDIDFMKRVDSRSYLKVTAMICRAKSLNQSKSAFLGSGTPADQKKQTLETIANYLKIIDQIITKNDKLLVVTYKQFVPIFKEKCRHKNVTFIHWGGSDARGSNEFSHYNKLMTIGWYRKPQHIYVGSVIAINNFDDYKPLFESKMVDANYLKNKLIADDMVQFFNRGLTRVAIDSEGNCEEVELYMFTGKSEEVADTIIESIEAEMPGIVFKGWQPKIDLTKLKTKQSKVEERADRVIEWLRGHIEKFESVEQKTIVETFGFSSTVMKKLLQSPYFNERLKEEYIYTTKLKQRGNPIRFQLPDAKQRL